MAEYNGNSVYLRMNSINVESLWKKMDISKSVADVEVTAGSGTVYEEHAAGLKGATAKITLAYNDTQAATDMAALYTALEVIPVVYGPEGNTAGKPCDSRNWLITGISGPSTQVSKEPVILEFDLVGTGTPTKDIHKGETF
jgi:hypothetical protein